MSHFSDRSSNLKCKTQARARDREREDGLSPPTPPAPWSTAAAQPAQAHARCAARTRSRRPAALRARISLAHSRRPPPHHPTTSGPAATSVARRRVALSWGHRYRPPLRTMSHRVHPEAVEAVSPAAVTWQSARYVRYSATLARSRYIDVAPQGYPCACAPRRTK